MKNISSSNKNNKCPICGGILYIHQHYFWSDSVDYSFQVTGICGNCCKDFNIIFNNNWDVQAAYTVDWSLQDAIFI